jgi:hypothetical protein
MSTPNPTIPTLKTAFLRTQINILSTPLKPSSTFPTTPSSTSDPPLPQKSIDEALLKANTILKKHNKVAYAPQAVRHVAEQIDRLYWNAGDPAHAGEIGEGEEWLRRGVDLSTFFTTIYEGFGGEKLIHWGLGSEELIEQIPETWSEEASTLAPENAALFTSLQSRLQELNTRRAVAREKVERYKAMKELLVPFADVEKDVQENVIVRDGEVERELERMKLLLLRVQRGVSGLGEPLSGAGEEDWDVDGSEEMEGRVLGILAGE